MAAQFQELVGSLSGAGARFALIGGLALAPHRVVRATQDVDLLVDGNQADTIHETLLLLGYRCLHRSPDAGNYLRGDERVDLLYATRPIARRLLAAARVHETPFGPLAVVGVEGLIGFKLQAIVNDPRRSQDLEDIRSLLRSNRGTVDLGEVREYFRLFQKEPLLEELLHELD